MDCCIPYIAIWHSYHSHGYDMNARWRYMGCSNPFGTASGRLLLNLAQIQAEFSLNSNEFSLRTALEFSQKNQLQKRATSDSEVRINGDAVQMDKLVHLHSIAIYTHLTIAGGAFLQLIFLAEFQCSAKRKFVAIQRKFSLNLG